MRKQLPKFRAWDAHNKTMLYYTLKDLAEGVFTYDEEVGSKDGQIMQSGFDNFTWMESTGLKDKHGVEIYEGDILAVKFYGTYVERIHWDGPPDAIAEVYYDLAGLRLTAAGAKDRRYADFWDFMDPYGYGGLESVSKNHSEIIGNVHQNPELLEQRKLKPRRAIS